MVGAMLTKWCHKNKWVSKRKRSCETLTTRLRRQTGGIVLLESKTAEIESPEGLVPDER